jgi:GntR family transcriptional regulator
MIQIDLKGSKSLYEQIVDGVKENIVKGLFKPGSKLPSVRELSTILTINPSTVSKAYIYLERQKIIYTVPGKGAYVSENYNPKADEGRIAVIDHTLRNLVVEAIYINLTEKELLTKVSKLFKEMKSKESDK